MDGEALQLLFHRCSCCPNMKTLYFTVTEKMTDEISKLKARSWSDVGNYSNANVCVA